ncbi:MAG: hypothetical protein RRX93_04175 [Bacteroidales bacterium]
MKGSIDFQFTFTYDGKPIKLGDTLYQIPSGNFIQIDEIQYFISNVSLIDASGNRQSLVETRNTAHYVDIKDTPTLTWTTRENLNAGVYEYVEFVYGFTESENRSNRFVNPPESFMFWPEALGGGYHYMKINGKWKRANADSVEFQNFGLHTGVGQSWENGVAVSFHPNYVVIRDSLQLFVTASSSRTLQINMEVSNWFSNPNLWNFELYGGGIMQNQKAQQALKENAWNVFSIKIL